VQSLYSGCAEVCTQITLYFVVVLGYIRGPHASHPVKPIPESGGISNLSIFRKKSFAFRFDSLSGFVDKHC
jgi:hypothetical protein